MPGEVRTALRYLGESKTGAPLKIDVVRVYEGAQGSEGLAGEEVYFLPLTQVSVQSDQISATRHPGHGETNVLEVLEEVGHCFSLDVGEDGLIQAIARTT